VALVEAIAAKNKGLATTLMNEHLANVLGGLDLKD
jgi:DNA-binding FadR family transcriptional regulator